jgi:hypothetical protein
MKNWPYHVNSSKPSADDGHHFNGTNLHKCGDLKSLEGPFKSKIYPATREKTK